MNGQTITERVMRRLLREAAATDGLAVFITKTDEGYKTAVVYDAELALNPGGSKPIWGKNETFLGTKLIRGLISIAPAGDPCWGASEVKFSAGKGLGKIIYNLGYAMSPSRKLIPDRQKVSQDARDAWGKVLNNKAFPKFRLDNKEHPKDTSHKDAHTEDPKDDCSVHQPDEKGNPLNYAYQGSGEEMGYMGSLKAAHQNVLNQIPKENRADFIEALEKGTNFFWQNNYDG